MIFEDEVLDEVKEREHKKDAASGESVDEVEEILRNDFDEKIEEQGEKFDEKLEEFAERLEKLEEMFDERLEKLEEKTESDLKKLSKVLGRLEDRLDKMSGEGGFLEALAKHVDRVETYVKKIYGWDICNRERSGRYGVSYWEENVPNDHVYQYQDMWEAL